MYLWCFTMSQNSCKKFLGKGVFQILAKIEMKQNKDRLFGCHFETTQHFIFVCAELWFFFIVHTYMVQISLQNSGVKVVFLGFHGTPLGTNGREITLVT